MIGGLKYAVQFVHGAIRDSAALDRMEIGVKALGTTARRNEQACGGTVGVPLEFGGVRFVPGCWVYADVDAVLVSPRRLGEHVAPQLGPPPLTG